jgi:signal peptidase I
MLTADQGAESIELTCGLAEEVIRTFGEVRLRVFGTSMLPSILPGDLLSIHRASLNDISPGEVVLFLQKGRLFVHRVVDRKVAATADNRGESCLVTRGDCMGHDDPPVSSAELLGRVVSVERDNRRVELRAHGSNRLIVRLLGASGRVTYLYARLAAYWWIISFRFFPRGFLKGFLGEAKCRA